jgi:hypothetical protein
MTSDAAEANHVHGITAFRSIVQGPCSRDESIKNVEILLQAAAEQMVRTFAAGLRVGRRRDIAKPVAVPQAPRLVSLTAA